MQFVHIEPTPPPPRTRGKAWTAVLRVVTLAYGLFGLTFGLAQLRIHQFSEEAWSETLTVWYAEALLFLAVFGGGALVLGMFTRSPKRLRRAQPLSDPLKTSTLAGVERGRGH